MEIVNDIIKSGFEPDPNRYGTDTLSSGSVTISSSIVKANSIILVSFTSSPSASPKGLYVTNISPNASFDIVDASGCNADVCWYIAKI